MKKTILACLLILLLQSCQTEEVQTWNLIPYPNAVTAQAGTFSFEKGVIISATSTDLDPRLSLFQKQLEDLGIELNPNAKQSIVLNLSTDNDLAPEAYYLKVNKKRIELMASDPSGIFYGLMTMVQALELSSSKTIPCGVIEDKPRFAYRGFMLDESRHFFGKEKVLQLIDQMSKLKLNTFHWHLTDTPGWRIEIDAYPKLTTVGGKGSHTQPDGPAQYYSKEDIRAIVRYAEERFVEIIPEIDMPGHAAAANRAYPEFSGGGSEKHPDFTFNPGLESTYEYLNTILEEVAELFPSSYIHLGGDEVHFGNEAWNTNDSIQALMQREGLETLVEVEHYFMRRMADYLQSINKKLAGWDEIIEAGVSKETALVYWWRHDKPTQLDRALAKDYPTVLCPRLPLYFDFLQDDSHTVGRRWDGFASLESVYAYPESTHQFTPQEADLIQGIQANLWTERLSTEPWLDFMTYPRIFALAESAWTNPEQKNWDRFNKTLPTVFKYLESQGIYFFDHLNPEGNGEPVE